MNKLDERIKEIGNLRAELKTIEDFIEYIPMHKRSNGNEHWIELIMKEEAITRCSIFGSRCFGIGARKSEFSIPVALRNDIIDIAIKRKDEVEKELNNLVFENKKDQS